MKDLTVQEWQRLKGVLDGVLELPREAQLAFLHQQLGETPRLLQHAQAFLEAGAEAEGLFGHPFRFTRLVAENEDSAELAGRCIGPYRILETLGSGGMGVVYKACRNIEDVTQVVALKVVKSGMDTGTLVERFRHERRMLAGLNHPHIAKLLDGGSTDSQLPYLVMEYVDGKPLFEYCREHALDLRQRLALFQKICMAVHVAHQNLIVHRDLKPSNILITREGEPKLLDFGIAKWLAPDGSDPRQLTRDGLFLMTPQYASPEQFLGEPITTASDIYALGILFYRLIAGLGPHPDKDLGWNSLKEAVCHSAWTKPSIRLAQAVSRRSTAGGPELDVALDIPGAAGWRRVRQLRGDLDNIAGMAMNREPSRRYNSAMQFASDIGRYLEGRVVLARPETFVYLCSKLIGRHRLAASLIAALLIVVLVFSTFVLVQQRRLVEQRDLAKVKGHLSEQVTQVLTEIFGAADPYSRNLDEMPAKALLDRGADRIVADTALEPKLRAELIEVMGKIYVNLGLLAEAKPLLDMAFESKQILYEPWRLEANTIHEVLGFYYLESGDYAKSQNHLATALAAYQRLGSPLAIPEARVKGYLGEVACLLGNYERSTEYHKAALDLVRQHQPDHVLAISGHLQQLAVPYYRMGQYRDSLAVLEQAAAVLGEGDQWPVQKADIKDELGIAYRKLGQLEKAEAYFKEGAAVRVKAFGARSLWAACSYNQLGWLYLRKGQYALSESLFLDALTIREALLDPHHRDIAISKNNLAAFYMETARFEEAETYLAGALVIRAFRLGRCHTKYAETLSNLGQVHLATGAFAQAEAELLEALETRETILEPGHPEIARVVYHLGEVRLAQGRYPESLAYFWRCYRRFEASYGMEHYTVGCTLAKLGEVYLALGEVDTCMRLLSRALVSMNTSVGPNHPLTAEVYQIIGKAEEARTHWLEAAWWYHDAYEIFSEKRGDGHPSALAAKAALRGVALKAEVSGTHVFPWPESFDVTEPLAMERR